MNTSKSLKELFLPIALKSGTVDADGNRTDEYDNWDTIIKETQQAIVEAVEGLIGSETQDKYAGLTQAEMNNRIQLRAEIRQAIKEWQ